MTTSSKTNKDTLKKIKEEAIELLTEMFDKEIYQDKKGNWKYAPDGSGYNYDFEMNTFTSFVEKVFSLGIKKGREEGGKEIIEEAVKFMKGKMIDMPMGSGMPLVIHEAHLRNWSLTHKQKEGK